MNFSTKAFGFLSSLEFFAYIAMCAALWGAIIAGSLKMGFWEFLELIPARVFYLAMFLNSLFAFFAELPKSGKKAAISIGLLTVLSGIAINYAYRFEGVLSLGEGESFSGYERVEKGFLAKERGISLTMARMKGNPFGLDKGAKALLFGDDVEPSFVSSGGHIRWASGINIKVLSIEAAPMVSVSNAGAESFFSSYVKLKLYPKGSQDYFQTEVLPHRFYFSLTGNNEKPIRIRVQRGKLTVADKAAAPGEKVEFEGYEVRYDSTSWWALMEALYYPGNMVIFIGLVVIALSAMFMPGRGSERK